LRSVGWAFTPKTRRVAPILAVAALLCCTLRVAEAEARPRKAPPRAAPAASAIFADEADCAAKGALEASDCHNAALNSHAEYEEKAPRLSSNEACTRFFGARNCAMRIGGGLQGIGFVPSYRGFRLVAGKGGGETMALPVLAGANAGVEFTPRPVSRLDTAQDGARGARAQVAWQNAHAPVIGSARGGGILRYREAPKGAAPDLSDDPGAEPSGPAATIPVKPSMLKSMQEEMRKYGTPPK
jgi:hypothetical protein